MQPAASDLAAIPNAARYLGYAGLLPFIATALGACLLEGQAQIASERALLSYAAVILSFMGAVHWGLAIRPTEATPTVDPSRMLIISVVPALIAWSALAMAPATALLVMTVAFVALASIDHRYTADGIAPRWYWRLRLPLTVVVVVCLLVTLVARRL